MGHGIETNLTEIGMCRSVQVSFELNYDFHFYNFLSKPDKNLITPETNTILTVSILQAKLANEIIKSIHRFILNH